MLKFQSQTLTEQAEALLAEGRALTALARKKQGSYAPALDCLTRSIRIFETLNLTSRLAIAQDALAFAYWHKGENDNARIILEAGLAILNQDHINERVLLTNTLVQIQLAAQQPESACQLSQEIALLAEQADDPCIKARFHNNFAMALEHLGEFDRAFTEYTAASIYFEEGKHHRHQAYVWNNLGSISIKTGELGQAHNYLDSAESFFKSTQDLSALGQVTETRAQAFLAQGNHALALQSINQSLSYLTGEEKGLQAESYRTKGRILARMGRLKESAESYQQAIDLLRETDSDPSQVLSEACDELLHGSLCLKGTIK